MKADPSTCVVSTTTTTREILLMLAQYISITLCCVSKLQLLLFWLDRTERAMDCGAYMCQERPAWAILIALSGVAVALTPEIEERSGLNGNRPCK